MQCAFSSSATQAVGEVGGLSSTFLGAQCEPARPRRTRSVTIEVVLSGGGSSICGSSGKGTVALISDLESVSSPPSLGTGLIGTSGGMTPSLDVVIIAFGLDSFLSI